MEFGDLHAVLRSMLSFGMADRDDGPRTRVLFVCMGNICRSPTAEAVFRNVIERAGMAGRIECDSAGTHSYHAGDLPDGRARGCAASRGYDMSRLRGRQVSEEDFERFDMVLAMDRHNLSALQRMCPPQHAGKVALLMDFAERHAVREVPDPYYGNAKAFEHVLDLIEDAAQGLLRHLRNDPLPGSPASAQ